MLTTKNPYIKSAYEQLQVISQDKQKRLEYEAREKAVRNHNQIMYETEQRGIIQGKFKIIKNLLNLNYNIDSICQITGLSKEEVQKFTNN